MNYALLVPTRERIAFFVEFIKNVRDTIADPSQTEILVALDNDYHPAIENVKTIQERYKPLKIKYFTRDRTIYLNGDYYNWLASKSEAQYLWVVADDVRFQVKHWDKLILVQLNEFNKRFPDKVFCVSIKDNTPKPNEILPKFPCFPLFTKQAYEASGMLLYPKIPTWGADYVAYQTYYPIHRLLEIHNCIYLNHISWHTRQVKEDKTAKRIGDIFNQLKNVPLHNIQRIEKEELPGLRNQILGYINNH